MASDDHNESSATGLVLADERDLSQLLRDSGARDLNDINDRSLVFDSQLQYSAADECRAVWDEQLVDGEILRHVSLCKELNGFAKK